MTVSNLPVATTAVTVTAGVTTYNFGFAVQDASYVKVEVADTNGNLSYLTYGTDYTVALADAPALGGVVTVTATLTAGHNVVIYRDTAIVQDAALPNQGPFFAKTIEGKLDQLTMVAQEAADEAKRSIKVPRGASVATDAQGIGPGEVPRYKADGTGFEGVAYNPDQLGAQLTAVGASVTRASAAADAAAADRVQTGLDRTAAATSETAAGVAQVAAETARAGTIAAAAAAAASAATTGEDERLTFAWSEAAQSASRTASAASATVAASAATATAAATDAGEAQVAAETAQAAAVAAQTGAVAARTSVDATAGTITNIWPQIRGSQTAAEAAQAAAGVSQVAAEAAKAGAETARDAAALSQTRAAAEAQTSLTSAVSAQLAETNAETAEAAAEAAQTATVALQAAAGVSQVAAETANAAATTARTGAETASVSAQAANAAAQTALTGVRSSVGAAVAAQAAARAAQTASETARDATARSQNLANDAKTAAESAKTSALAAYANFRDQYLGSSATAPTQDLDGTALDGGELYYDSALNRMRLYNGTAWVNAAVDATGALLAASNLSDLPNKVAARNTLGLKPAVFIRNLATSDSYSTAGTGSGTINLEFNRLADTNVTYSGRTGQLLSDADHLGYWHFTFKAGLAMRSNAANKLITMAINMTSTGGPGNNNTGFPYTESTTFHIPPAATLFRDTLELSQTALITAVPQTLALNLRITSATNPVQWNIVGGRWSGIKVANAS